MYTRTAIVFVMLLTGCGSPVTDVPTSESFTCSKSDRTGTYLGRYTETSGNCGPINDELARLENAEPVEGYMGCTLTGPDRWTDDECTLERSTECPDGSHLVAITTQQDSAGERGEGTLALTIGTLCRSTYRVVFERQ